jgi:CPA2 family monovalent cation:H+ antiporter-2
MSHLPHLIHDLCFILMTAAAVSLIFKRLNQPVVLGYLIAGFLLSPHFQFLPTIKDTGNIKIWAEIGVIFLLFALGLEFSFKKLAKVGKSSSITATFEIIFMLGAGYFIGQILGWSQMDSIFLGGILSISSTTIIVRAFEELGMKGKDFVSLVFGVLIVEDLIAILLLVLLSSVAVTQSLSGLSLAVSGLRLGFFIVLCFLLGISILPSLLRKLRRFLSDETLLIVAIGLCLSMVIIANGVGFSPALGAFMMGSLLAETREGHRIEKLIVPIRDLFAAIFFVSVGLLIDPKVLSEHSTEIFLITVVTIVGKFFSSTLGALISGANLKCSVRAGLSLAQIGEFSFIIATLGLTLEVTSPFLYPIAVAVSAITTFSTPYLIQYSSLLHQKIEARLPKGIQTSLARYQIAMSSPSDKNAITLFWEEYGIKTVFNSVVTIALTLTMSRLVMPYVEKMQWVESQVVLSLIMCAITLILSSPFLWAIFASRPSRAQSYPAETLNQLRRLQIGVSLLRFLVGCVLAGFVVSNFTSILAFSGVLLLSLSALAAFFFSRYSEHIYNSIEAAFIQNLTENERAELEKRAHIPELAPWDATLSDFVLSPSSVLVAKTLQDSRLKEQFGVTVAMIERGNKKIFAPTRGDLLLPYDRIYLIGNDEQLSAAREMIEVPMSSIEEAKQSHFGLTSLTILASDPFANKSIRDCGLREAVNGLIVGIERNGIRILNPDSGEILKEHDLVWLVGDRSLIELLRKSKNLATAESRTI